jgi:predicted nuclease of predicted toxin-antitoxin system
MRLLLDEQISPQVAVGLRALGHDAVGVVEVGLRSADDAAVWRHAIQEGRAVVTYNLDDFVALAHEAYQDGSRHHGLILVSTRTLPTSDIGGLIHSLSRLMREAGPIDDQALYLQASAAR